MQALLDGKKIKNKCFLSSEYVYFDGKNIRDQEDDRALIVIDGLVMFNNWEIVE